MLNFASNNKQRIMGKIKFLAMMIAMLAMSVSFSSCGDDNQPETDYYDYYIQCKVSGGGLDSSELNYLESQLNAELSDVEWEMMKKEDAIYYFDREMKEVRSVFAEGMSGITGTLYIKFILKTTEGDTIKTTTLNVTKDGCTLN